MIDIIERGSVLPVCVIDDVSTALPLAECLMRSGIKVMEVTLRTPDAVAAIAAIAKGCPDMVVGAGTIRHKADILKVRQAGARFLVTPGTTPALIEEIARWDIAALPGAATVSESMQLMDFGYPVQKLFPADALGGPGYLQSLQGPLPDIAYCPSGGITRDNYKTYLSLPNVHCVSGSWLSSRTMIQEQNWAQIEQLAAEVALR